MTNIKYAPFATRQRRGYIRDSTERDLGVHLETALRGVIIGDRWPKSGVDIIVTILEGEEDRWWGDEVNSSTAGMGIGDWGMLNVLAGCITVASAAIVDAGIDCVDVVSGGVAAIVRNPSIMTDSKEAQKSGAEDESDRAAGMETVLDPCPSEHQEIISACLVAYLASRDEVTELWIRGSPGNDPEALIDSSIKAAVATRSALSDSLMEATELKYQNPMFQ
jgi:exosome complex component MTR3